MEQVQRASVPLTLEQRSRVEQNLGLVAVHLKRYVPNSRRPTCDREWKDLFQEGCLGLIEAAKSFESDRGIEFAAYALPRIHRAVSDALRRKQRMIDASDGRGSCAASKERAADSVRIHSLSGGWEEMLESRRRNDPSDSKFETVGERLHEKFRLAVKSAVEEMSADRSTRGDRETLVRELAEKRLLVAEEADRTPLRMLARLTGSSFGRVAACEREFESSIRRTLEADPEFEELRRQSRTSPLGTEQPMEPGVDRRIAVKSAAVFFRTFRRLGREDRARVLYTLLEFVQVNFETMIRAAYRRLPAALRDILHDELAPQKKSKSCGGKKGARIGKHIRTRDPSVSAGKMCPHSHGRRSKKSAAPVCIRNTNSFAHDVGLE